MENRTYIYGLACPLDGKVHYVGQSVDPTNRFAQHINTKTRHSLLNAKDRWLCGLEEQGLEPTLVILEEIGERKGHLSPPEVLNRISSAERRWIRRLLDSGHPLGNVQGVRDKTRMLEEARERGRKLAEALDVHPDELSGFGRED
jgi:hypothetical protein